MHLQEAHRKYAEPYNSRIAVLHETNFLNIYLLGYRYRRKPITMKPKPVRPGAGIPALNEIMIIAIAISSNTINNTFFISFIF
jgi:hypothetical protein